MIIKKILQSSLLLLSLEASQEVAIETITVSATKLTDSQMNNASSIDVLKKDKIEDFNLSSVEDLSSIVSNTNISGLGNRSDRTFTFRGVSNYIAYESSVAMYFDDIPIPMSYGYGAFNTNDVDFLEVLKGPQGTLFGKNAQAGVINIYSKPISNKLESELSLDISTYKSRNIYGRVSAPTKNKNLSFALSFSKETSDGYSKNILTNKNADKRDLENFSAKLKYDIDDNTQVKLNYIKTIIDDAGSPFKVNTKSNPFIIDNEPYEEYLKMHTDMASISIKKEDKNYKFSSITAFSKQDVEKEDYIAILGGLVLNRDIEIQELSQEFRLNYYYENFDFLVGAFYSDKLKFDYDENQELLALNLNSTNNISNTDTNRALFFQNRYWINQNLSLTAGLRYQQFIRDFSKDLQLFSNVQHQGKSTTKWNYLTPSLSLDYYNPNGYNLYLTYSKGYRPGGYNYREETNVLTPFKEETTDSYEFGYKYDANNYFIHTSIFYNDIQNQRINTLDDNLATHTFNADKSYSYGLESKIGYENDILDIYSTFGVIKAKIKEFNSNKEYEDKNIIDVPQATASLGVKYKIDNNLYFQTNLKYMGKRYYNLENSAFLAGLTTTDIELGYKNKDSKFSLYINNLFDKEYSDFMIATPSNNYYHFGKPRVVGVKFTRKF